ARMHDGGLVGHIALDDVEARIAIVLTQVAAATDHEAVENPHRPTVRDQTVDQMASDESASAGNDVQTHPNPQATDRRIVDRVARSNWPTGRGPSAAR